MRNLILVPRFAFSLSSVEARKPLSPTARRKGHVGCFIVLANIPSDAKIALITNGIAANPAGVRRQYERLRPLAKLSREMRGWTLDVLNVVRSLVGAVREPPLPARHRFPPGSGHWRARADALARLHPANRHIRDKIRQQLQVLRDLGFVEFLGRGEYGLS